MNSAPDQHTKRPNLALLMVGAGIVSMVLGYVLWSFLEPHFEKSNASSKSSLPEEIASAYIPKGRPLAGIRLTDHNQQPFTEQRLKDKWTFMFFGYTHCPDVCPTSLLVMKAVWGRFPDIAKQSPEPQMVFVSVDPDRDKFDILKTYTTYYHPEFLGVTAEHKFLDILTTQVGALYGYEDDEGEGNYVVNHSSQVVLIDPQGNFRAVFSPPLIVDNIVKTFTAIREYHPGS